MPNEFWQELMNEVASDDFLALAESYEAPDKEDSPWQGRTACFQDFGMVPYDKRLYDIVRHGNAATIRWYLFNGAPSGFLDKTI